MADFQSSKTAEEIEGVLTGALLYTTSQDLTEEQKALVRQKIGATELGEGIKILAHFDTVDELMAAVPNPSAGNSYSVGAELPFDLYVYDFFQDTWLNHGPIRASDITARFAQNMAVPVGAWEEYTEVFTDFTYKATIPLANLTGNDFPIVGFGPSDAISGNFCPVCYAFDGYVEIWARAIPETDIIVPSVTYIVMDTESGENGNVTKGITNASGGIATGGIGAEQIANGAVSVVYRTTVTANWSASGDHYYRGIAISGLLETDNPIVDLVTATDYKTAQAQIEAWNCIYNITTGNGKLAFCATEAIQVNLPIQVLCIRK